MTVAVDWSLKAVSGYESEARLLRALLDLFNGGAAVDVDCTFSLGPIWRGLPKPSRCFDLFPQVEGCERADARHMPVEVRAHHAGRRATRNLYAGEPGRAATTAQTVKAG